MSIIIGNPGNLAPQETDSDHGDSDSDSDFDSGPTRKVPRTEAPGVSDFEFAPDAAVPEPELDRDIDEDFMHDSDSEVEDEVEHQANPNPEPARHEVDDDWISMGEEEWAPSWQNPYNEEPKLLFDANHFKPVDFFYRFFPEDLFTMLAEQTNLYARQTIQRLGVLQQHSRLNKWTETTTDEMKAFTALQISMGLVTKPAIHMYWEENWLIGTPGFSKVMSRNRYQLINSLLHFVDNEDRVPRGQPGHNVLFKVQPIIDRVRPTYQEAFAPGRDLSVDESLAAFKGRLSFKQYLPMKPTKWGIKFWVVTDSSCGFCLDWSVYTGKNDQQDRGGDGLSTRVVKDLTRRYAGSGRHVYMDNFYSSPELYEFLHNENLGACGTVRLSRRGIPPIMREASQQARKGEPPKFFRKGDLMGVTWHDTKRVSVLSTIHGTGCTHKEIRDKRSETGRRQVQKPIAVEGYNKAMGGVDLLDQRMAYYKYPHKHLKWYMVVYHFMVEVALVNAFLAYRIATKDMKRSTRSFRLSVINSLLDNYAKTSTAGRPKALRESTRDNRLAPRLTGQHFAEQRPGQGKNRYYPDCVVCSKKGRNGRVTTSYFCETCKLPMCLTPCFKRYHSP
ncbi:piggyBac transposable element-derived protein 4 [Strongylocentrotus purpuratus]|uniref:PiggyBac transposable element-derived protein domain-containing protein n=1 Tax=Strongylocentrotus purpuratus TaxID=7668 RepID=A0A7M7NP63_STRPU|nr:piggyBac transposable element-derived protein 4 [Strongylocentrotus purpuratus]